MENRRNTVWGLLLAAVLIALVLTGCRAFVPEAVIVNKAPETYIIGAPVENSGGYYHYHVYWYGSDVDGKVARFVWALTDTTLQDPDTADDEEDLNFNPALDASTLAIGHWTTKTDSIFDFRIDQGTRPSADFTLHMVAQDDMGDFDRTPARLHFFSNTLGNPVIDFFRISGTDTIPIAPGVPDTVGFGRPYTMGWKGSTPNILGYSDEALAKVDTVYPFTDGLFGYKWQLTGSTVPVCDQSTTDCWHPRRFNEATGDSFSYYGPGTSLHFENLVEGSPDPFLKRLPSATVSMLVNTVDVAGVEVATDRRVFSFIVNYEPETVILNKERDWDHPEDEQVYPYYIRLNDPTQTKVPFGAGERIPDRTYVVFKALAKDNAKDLLVNPDYKIGIKGYATGVFRSIGSAVSYPVTTPTSVLDTDPAWDKGLTGWYADTLGFLVAPRMNFTMSMQSVDEQGRTDNSPAQLSFDVGYPPCVECVELKASPDQVAAPDTVGCVDPVTGSNSCFEDTASFVITSDDGARPNSLKYLRTAFIAVNKATNYVQVVGEVGDLNLTNFIIPAYLYNMTVYMHGRDDFREAWSDSLLRILSWRYQVDHDCDRFNQIKDGGGTDDIRYHTWGASSLTNDGQLSIDPNTGVWKMNVYFAVPQEVMDDTNFGINKLYLTLLLNQEIMGDADRAQQVLKASMMMIGGGSVSVIAGDQTTPDTRANLPLRPCQYNIWDGLRPPVDTPAGDQTWRTYRFTPTARYALDMTKLLMEGREGVEPALVQASTKHFRVTVIDGVGNEVDCNTDGVNPYGK